MGESSSHSLVQKILETVNVITSIGEFKVQKKECSTLTRRVKLLVPVFEEVRDLSIALSEDDFACFHALEAALNTAKVLLLLCNKGSKLYLVRFCVCYFKAILKKWSLYVLLKSLLFHLAFEKCVLSVNSYQAILAQKMIIKCIAKGGLPPVV